ncbi:MAG: hypothetical protein AAFY73_11750 [Pseudomonadota bacterium]
MTQQERDLADEKMRAETVKLQAEVSKIIAETAKINKENQWYLVVISSGFLVAVTALMTFIVNAIIN